MQCALRTPTILEKCSRIAMCRRSANKFTKHNRPCLALRKRVATSRFPAQLRDLLASVERIYASRRIFSSHRGGVARHKKRIVERYRPGILCPLNSTLLHGPQNAGRQLDMAVAGRLYLAMKTVMKARAMGYSWCTHLTE